jgi:hypothetical protein
MIVSNAEIIAVNQDPLGISAHLAERERGGFLGWSILYDIWVGPLSGGRYVAGKSATYSHLCSF